VQIGEFIEKHIASPKKLEYYAEKDTTYAEMSEYYEVPSCTEGGEVVWKEIEAVTRHPVINKDGTNTMLKVTTKEEREIIATKAKSFLKLVNGKLIASEGETLKVGDYIPVSTKQIDFKESDISKIFKNEFFGYTRVTIEQPLKENGVVVKDKKGTIKTDSSLRDNERIPLGVDIEEYFEKEVKPHLPESWMDRSKDSTGYEINFTKYFYQYKPLRSLNDLTKELLDLEKESDGLMNKLIG
jgi:type I restriction enzyme M protein